MCFFHLFLNINNYTIKIIFYSLLITVLTLLSCSDSTCKDLLSINLGIEDDCQYSKLAFHIANGQYVNWNKLETFTVTKSEVSINGKSAGVISKIVSPNNCSTPGVVNFQMTSGTALDWSNVVTLSNCITV